MLFLWVIVKSAVAVGLVDKVLALAACCADSLLPFPAGFGLH
jgi:hypothetical protein